MADGFIELKPGQLETREGLTELNRMLRDLYENIPGNTDDIRDFSGFGSPENAIAAAVGSTFRRKDGGGSTTFYVKETGTGNTGWVAK